MKVGIFGNFSHLSLLLCYINIEQWYNYAMQHTEHQFPENQKQQQRNWGIAIFCSGYKVCRYKVCFFCISDKVIKSSVTDIKQTKVLEDWTLVWHDIVFVPLNCAFKIENWKVLKFKNLLKSMNQVLHIIVNLVWIAYETLK